MIQNTNSEDTKNEVIKLQRIINAYEKLAKLQNKELKDAIEAISAYEIVEEVSRQEKINMISELEVFHELDESSIVKNGIIEILRDKNNTEENIIKSLENLQLKEEKGFYSDLFRILTHLNIEEEEAKSHWEKIQENIRVFNHKMGYPVGFRVAMLDYLLNHANLLKNPKFIDITIYENIVRSSITDELTGIYNKRYFDILFKKELKRGQRYNRVFSIFLFDIDDFKTYNDTFGHHEGDKVLKLVGTILFKIFRSEDSSFRVGGEEFLVILPELEVPSAILAAKRFTQELKMKSEKLLKRKITVSGGISAYPKHGDSTDILFQKADKALYLAKSQGKDQIIEAPK
ncbi:MAG: GGDEF domain-containing protein [Leptospiraceae bacterium]|nr:GGDEF domain-containing protein [Leptospiraceae bacterium]MCK6380935.1 GGDEF domain-containing protein [Leptospiraceae bacterium]NUM40009.1 GGDEF domain-containing protein [Leptospiraceae bacterium]